MHRSIKNRVLKFFSAFCIALCIGLLSPAPGAFSAQKRGEDAKISINFVDVEISSIVKIMSELTGKNFLFDDTVKGKVTIVAPMKLTVGEALKLFTSALELKKYTIITTGKAYKVISLTQARQSAAKVIKPGQSRGGAIDSYIVRLIPLNFISAQEAFTLVQPLVSRYGQLSIFSSRNALLVVDSVSNTKKIFDIIASVDTEPMMEEPELIYLKHTRAETVAELLRVEARRVGLGSNDKRGAASSTGGITPDIRLNAIILSLPVKARANLKKFISVLDTPSTESSNRIHVYYLENADAVSLSAVLTKLINTTQKKEGKTLSSRVSITPEKRTNSLIVMASPADYQGIVQVIKKLDRRPKQVFVETMITEVSIGKAIDLGTKWRLSGVSGGEPIVIGGVGTIDQSEIQKIINGMAGFSIGGLGNYISVPVTKPDGTTFSLSAPGFAALFSLSVFKDSVNILSTPHILTSDNSEAEIIVGKNVPFLSSIERQATTTNQPLLQSIERKDIGITLRIKPKISEGNFVKLELYQEISALATTTVSGASDLITTKRSAKTTVVVKDKQTVVIGGLIQTQKVKSTTKIPILGDIPILNLLFKYTSTKDEKTNLLIFITPHIIDDFSDLEELRSKKENEYNRDGTIELPYKKSTTDDSTNALPVDKKGNITERLPQPTQELETVIKKNTLEPVKPAAYITENTTEPVKPAAYITENTTEPVKPAAYIKKVRTGEHANFDRVVLDLTRPAKYTVEHGKISTVVTVHNATADNFGAANISTPLIRLTDPVVIQKTGKTPTSTVEIFHNSGSRVKSFTLTEPFRIVVDIYR